MHYPLFVHTFPINISWKIQFGLLTYFVDHAINRESHDFERAMKRRLRNEREINIGLSVSSVNITESIICFI